MQTSRLMRVAVVAVAAGGGCKVLDDDEPPIGTTAASEPSETGDGPTCGEDIAVVAVNCEPPQQWWVDYSEGESTMILIDDPVATLGIGPNAWLVRIDAATDYVGTYHHEGEHCDTACGWCRPGELVCHGGLDENGEPRCWACIPMGVLGAAQACVEIVKACGPGGEGEGADETGDGTTGGVMEYDCSTWQPGLGVKQSRDGSITVAAALVEDALLYQGEPLASCDDTRFRHRPDGYFEISRMADGGLLAMMGLELGDVIVALNGKPLNGLGAAIQALDELASEASFTVTINRGAGRFDLRVNVR